MAGATGTIRRDYRVNRLTRFTFFYMGKNNNVERSDFREKPTNFWSELSNYLLKPSDFWRLFCAPSESIYNSLVVFCRTLAYIGQVPFSTNSFSTYLLTSKILLYQSINRFIHIIHSFKTNFSTRCKHK